MNENVDIHKWVHVNTSDEHCSKEFDTYEEARRTAADSATPVAVVELTYRRTTATTLVETALVWTPEGREHATVLTWPPEGYEQDERKRYVLQYRDASGFEWVQACEGFDRRGDVLAARDEALADEQDGLPKGRHRAVDMETGTVIEWQHEDRQAD